MEFFNIFKKKKPLKKEPVVDQKPILKIYCDAGECLWFYDKNGNLDHMPDEWEEDETFMDLYNRMCLFYMTLFDFEKLPYYQGFRDDKHKEETKKLFEDFTECVNRLNNGRYEIENYLDVEEFVEMSERLKKDNIS